MIFNNIQGINFNLTLMIIVFNKYRGTGNDFIIPDNRKELINPDDFAEAYAPAGTNVDFAEITDKGIYVRTSERGVEEESHSCGTVVTAAAIVSVRSGQIDTNPANIKTKGGNLSVSFKINEKNYSDIWLSGPATFDFEGMIEV
jgi:diaminopimelate epimerase